MKRYEGKKVVIIGGTSGMGLATAKMLLDGGARVLVTGRSKEGLESARKELGNEAIVVSSDARLARSRKHLLLYGVPFLLWGSLILLGCKLMEIMRRFDEWAA
jgi:NAD(P)-dependent dehydrogenase (short-subunit alcohol dehydrogenase family)